MLTVVEASMVGAFMFAFGVWTGMLHRVALWSFASRVLNAERAVAALAARTMNRKTSVFRRCAVAFRGGARGGSPSAPQPETPDEHVNAAVNEAFEKIADAFDSIADARIRWYGTLPEKGDVP